jgi:hypothetical protein
MPDITVIKGNYYNNEFVVKPARASFEQKSVEQTSKGD